MARKFVRPPNSGARLDWNGLQQELRARWGDYTPPQQDNTHDNEQPEQHIGQKTRTK